MPKAVPINILPAVPEVPAVPCQPNTVKLVPFQVTALLGATLREWFTLAASSMVEPPPARFNVDELVKVVPDVIPVVPSLPPLSTNWEANVAVVDDGFNRSSPDEIVVVPV